MDGKASRQRIWWSIGPPRAFSSTGFIPKSSISWVDTGLANTRETATKKQPRSVDISRSNAKEILTEGEDGDDEGKVQHVTKVETERRGE